MAYKSDHKIWCCTKQRDFFYKSYYINMALFPLRINLFCFLVLRIDFLCDGVVKSVYVDSVACTFFTIVKI